jgi:hypothetical protein
MYQKVGVGSDGLSIMKNIVENFYFSTQVNPGDNFHVYRGLRHRMIAIEDSELFEFSTQHFDSDSYRVEKGD